ncbi:MAG: DISARM system phospholipase D-like protein DrmC [Aureliella sp.]
MTNPLAQLSDHDLQTLIDALASERIVGPYSELLVSRFLSSAVASNVSKALKEYASLGFTTKQISATLELLREDRRGREEKRTPIDLVVSGPEAAGAANRDTAVVVNELFKHAQESVLVVGYAVYQGQKVFQSLADRMEQMPNLTVRFFLDVARSNSDDSKQDIVVSRFVRRFKDKQWPKGRRLPEVYYDPRSSANDTTVRSSLHAKCVVVDGIQVFVSSANFTEAGQERNIEIGLKIQSEWLGGRIIRHFELLRDQELVSRAI